MRIIFCANIDKYLHKIIMFVHINMVMHPDCKKSEKWDEVNIPIEKRSREKIYAEIGDKNVSQLYTP